MGESNHSGAGPMDHNISSKTGKNPPKRNHRNVDYRTYQEGEACPESQPAATDLLNVQPSTESGIGPAAGSGGNPHGQYGSKEDAHGGREMSY